MCSQVSRASSGTPTSIHAYTSQSSSTGTSARWPPRHRAQLCEVSEPDCRPRPRAAGCIILSRPDRLQAHQKARVAKQPDRSADRDEYPPVTHAWSVEEERYDAMGRSRVASVSGISIPNYAPTRNLLSELCPPESQWQDRARYACRSQLTEA